MVRLIVRPRCAAIAFVALWCTSCAPPLMKLPAGRGLAAGDAAQVLQDATRACQAVSTLTAEVAVSGSVGGRGLRGRFLAGLAAPSSARLEAITPFGPPLFIFVARNEDATLLLTRDSRLLEHGRPAEVLEAIAGVPIDAADLRLALTGCVAAPRMGEATQAGDDWRVVPAGDGDVYLHREGGAAPWRVVAALHQRSGAVSWRSEYRAYQRGGASDGLPTSVRLASVDGKRFDLRLTLSQVELNAPLGAEAFQIQRPAGVEPLSLDELKRSGPLSNGGSGK